MEERRFGNWKNWQVIIGALIPIMVLYSLTLGTSPIPFADSLELITAGKIASLAHPPGYGLHTLILHGLLGLIEGKKVAWVSNVYSAGLQIMTLGVIGLIIGKLSDSWGVVDKRKRLSIVLTIWIIGLGRYFWFSASLLEVFSLNNFLIVCLIYLGMKIVENGKGKFTNYLWGLIAGLALGHQQISILISLPLLVGLCVWLFKRKLQKSAGQLIIGLIVGLLFSAVITFYFGVSGSEKWVSWRMVPDWQGVWSIMTRADYTGMLVEQRGESHAYLKRFDLGESWQGILKYGKLLIDNYGLVGILLITWTGYAVWREKRKRWGKALLGLLIVNGLGMAVYLPIVNYQDIGYKIEAILVERIYSQGYILAGLLIGIGIIKLLKILGRKEAKLFVILMLLGIFNQGLGNYEYANVSRLKEPWVEIKNGLNKLPERSVLFCFGDWSCFGTIYAQAVENVRKDVLIVPVTPQIRLKNLKDINLVVNYPDNPWRMSEWFGWARRENRPIAVMEISDNYKNWLGFNDGNGHLNTVSDNFPMWQCGEKKMQDETLLNLTEGGKSPAHEYMRLTRQNNLENNWRIQNRDNEKEIPVCLSATDLYKKARICKAKNEPCAWNNYMQAIMLDPRNIEIRLDLANYLLPLTPELAKREYKLVLNLDADNKVAKSMLNEMRSVVDLDKEW